VDHDHDADGARRQAPRVLEHVALLLRRRVLEHDLEHLGKVLAQVVRRGALFTKPKKKKEKGIQSTFNIIMQDQTWS